MIAMSLPVGHYFTPAEMRCHDGTHYPEHWGVRLAVLFDVLDNIREAWGGPLLVVSGYRTPEYNQKIEGATKSQHVDGRAVDIRPIKRDLTFSDIHKLDGIVEAMIRDGKLPALGGKGCYPLVRSRGKLVPGWLHVDVRTKPPNGHIARWEGAAQGHEQTV